MCRRYLEDRKGVRGGGQRARVWRCAYSKGRRRTLPERGESVAVAKGVMFVCFVGDPDEKSCHGVRTIYVLGLFRAGAGCHLDSLLLSAHVATNR